jgi:hypothetical protein
MDLFLIICLNDGTGDGMGKNHVKFMIYIQMKVLYNFMNIFHGLVYNGIHILYMYLSSKLIKF